MEGDKEAYLEEASKALRRQRKTISDLESEKQQLARSINVSRLDAGPLFPNLLGPSCGCAIIGSKNISVPVLVLC